MQNVKLLPRRSQVLLILKKREPVVRGSRGGFVSLSFIVPVHMSVSVPDHADEILLDVAEVLLRAGEIQERLACDQVGLRGRPLRREAAVVLGQIVRVPIVQAVVVLVLVRRRVLSRRRLRSRGATRTAAACLVRLLLI